MSEYLNAKYIHIATEVLYGCMLTYFVYSRNKQLSQHIQLLESKLMRYEQLLQEHDNILQTLLRKHGEVVPSKQTQQTLNKKILLEQKLNQGTPQSSVIRNQNPNLLTPLFIRLIFMRNHWKKIT